MTSDHALVQIVDEAVAEAIRRAGDRVRCRSGCTHCCIGPFAVTERDLNRLRAGIGQLTDEMRSRLAARSREARAVLKDGFPGDWREGRVSSQAEADEFDLRHPWLPCPVLDLETGACSLHAWRPVACRLHGPALRVNGVALRHCRLNYEGASEAEIERCRVDLTTGEAAPSALTYIAWAEWGGQEEE